MRRKTVQNHKCQRQRGARDCRVTRSSRTELQGRKRGSGRTGQQKRTPAVRGAPSNRSSPLSFLFSLWNKVSEPIAALRGRAMRIDRTNVALAAFLLAAACKPPEAENIQTK